MLIPQTFPVHRAGPDDGCYRQGAWAPVRQRAGEADGTSTTIGIKASPFSGAMSFPHVILGPDLMGAELPQEAPPGGPHLLPPPWPFCSSSPSPYCRRDVGHRLTPAAHPTPLRHMCPVGPVPRLLWGNVFEDDLSEVPTT